MRCASLGWIVGLIVLSSSLYAVADAPTLWGIPLGEYAQRRTQLSQMLESDQMAILVSESSPPTQLRFRQESNFMYLTGLEAMNGVLVILPPDSPMHTDAVLFLPRQSRVSRLFEGPLPEPSEQTRRETGIQDIRERGALREFLAEALRHHPRVLVNRPARTTLADALREANPEAQIFGVERLMARMRVVKSPAEIAIMRKAVQASIAGHRALAARLAPGVHEYELEGAAQEAFRRHGSEREGYPMIIGSGPNACILHYNANKRRVGANELVLVDIGAEYSYYTADITRTYPASGRFTPRQRELYVAVLDALKLAEKEAKPGITLGQLHQKVVQFFRNHTLRAKDENGNEQTLDRFFVHGLSHMLGMDVHDLDPNEPLRPGMVFTIEPGLYIPAEGIGIRIEDDYLVTETGVENLSRALPREPNAVERMVRGARRR
ncbi:MAG: Xaa-Pro aminopeptidase [Fimbriimonadales bacterium]|nr:MAG: Xaa-Pro aminopeptidase [Fimbriimonadales bacterium]GIV10769.1 MAG: Xaa-Pro aminopeptidase [Fimbriimonadales bacterium]